jgi:hypothetical protein
MPRASIWVSTLGSAFLLTGGAFAQAPAATPTPPPPPEVAAAMAEEKEVQALFARVTEVSARIRDAESGQTWKFQITQGDILIQLAVRAKTAERDNWLRMAADCFHSAMVGSPDGNTLAQDRLRQLAGEISRTYRGSPVALYAAVQEIEADYLRAMNKPGSTPDAAKAFRCGRMERFAVANPKVPETHKILMDAAQDYEALGKKDDASRCYSLLAQRCADKPLGKTAASAVVRLRLLGQPARLKLPLLYAAPDAKDREFDLASAQGKIVVVYFWSSKCPEADQDFRTLKQLTDHHQHQGVEVVYANLDENPAQARAFLSGRLTLGTHVHDNRGVSSEIANHYGLPPLPQAILVAKDGTIVRYGLPVDQVEMEVVAQLPHGK